MHSAPPTTDRTPTTGVPSRGALWGTLGGFNGWIVGLFFYATAKGALPQVWDIIALGGILSTGLALLVLDSRPMASVTAFLGKLAIALALVLALNSYWVAPRLQSVPALADSVVSSRISDLPIALLGLIGLLLVALRDPPWRSAFPTPPTPPPTRVN